MTDSICFTFTNGALAINSNHLSLVELEREHSDSQIYTYSIQEENLINPLFVANEITKDFRPLPTINSDSGFLPPGVRFISNNIVVFEKPPCIKTVFYIPQQLSAIDDTVRPIAYSIPIPWQLYVATYSNEYYCSDVYMYFMNTSLNSLDQPLYMPTLPNFYTNGLLCRPRFSSFEEVDRYTKDVSGVIASAYDWIWNNGTNNDLTESMVHLLLQNQNGKICVESRKLAPFSFPNHRLRAITYLAPAEVMSIFSAWEKMTIDEVLQYQFPNPSEGTNFQNSNMEARDYDAYHDQLYSYIYDVCDSSGEFSDYDGTPEELVNLIISDESYDHNVYVSWLIENNHIPLPNDSWSNQMNYSEILSRISIGLKNIFRTPSNLNADITYIESVLFNINS